ncbi:MAG: tetratricopeptide repeat protein [Myxococcaceae bacterium]|nr:tetratricopeptide repeat protein [Myxococcaceae bacterium]MCI0669112.1 tetratricopeptide repeat protein [Myxococcaceae bacterium]
MFAEPPSSSLGPYWLASRVASGDVTELHLARKVEPDGRLGPLVLLRRPVPQVAGQEGLAARLMEEASLAVGLEHPNVARVLDAGSDGGTPYVVLPMLEGCTVAQLLEHAHAASRRIPVGLALHVVVGACRGLRALHRVAEEAGRPVAPVPRALTAHAVHVSRRGEVRVLEAGTALLRPADGVPGSAAPEVREGRGVDARADVYSAGFVLRALLEVGAGGVPVLPGPVERVLRRALAHAPAERFADVEAFAGALEEVAREVGDFGGEGLGALVEECLRGRSGAWDEGKAGLVVAPALETPRGARGRWWTGAPFVSALVLALHVVVAVYVLWPERPVSERLATAASAQDRVTREEELAPLARDADASPEDLKVASQLLMEVDGFVTAQALAEALEARAPGDVEGPLLLARASAALKMGRRAEEALARAAHLAPSDPRSDVVLADLREQEGDVDAALEALARAHERHAGAAVSLRYGVLLSANGRLAEAARVLSALAEEPGDGTALAELAFVLYRQDRFEEARLLLQRAAREHPQLGLAHYYLGAVLFRLGDAAGAERAWREADRKAPEDVRALAALCELLGSRGRPEASLAVAQELRRRFRSQLDTLHPACLSR